MDESKRESAATTMRQINRAWLNGRVEDLAPLVHAEIVLVFPDFAGQIQNDTTPPAGICGCFDSRAESGLPSGGPFLR